MRRFVRTLGIAVALTLPSAPVRGADPKPARDPAKARADAADKALGWLADRLFKLPDSSGSPRKPFTLAIAGIDFLLVSGSTDDRGAGDRLRRCKDGLLSYIAEVERRSRDPRELPSGHGVADSSKLCQYTWALGAASLFFAEARSRGLFKTEAERAFSSIVSLLAQAEDANGGFGHGRIAPPGTEPLPGTKGLPTRSPALRGLGLGYPSTLVSSTNVVALGLGVARPWFVAAAVPAGDAMLVRLRAHYPEAQVAGGNFPYDRSQRSPGEEPTSVGRTAGAIAAMRAIGVPPTSETVRRAEAFLDRRMDETPEGHGSPSLNVFLGAVAARMRGVAAQREFERRFLPRIMARAREDGSLDCICEGKAFGVTCDSPDHGMLAGLPGEFADGQRAYVTALLLFPLLLDRKDGPRMLHPPAGAAPVSPAAPAVTPEDPVPAGK